MATYIAKKNGEQVNIIVIEPAQVARYERLTGVALVPVEQQEPSDSTGATMTMNEMESALNELGVETRE